MKNASTRANPVEFVPGDRVVFFDHLRFLFVTGVVVQHAGMAYNFCDWWPVADDASIVVALTTAFGDGFLMPALFFIAGYFAIPSICRKGGMQFIIAKLRRLGVVWLVCTLFIGPMLPLVYHYTRDGMVLLSGYGQTWRVVMANAVRFDVGILPPMAQVMQQDLFYQRYMWFIGVLIAFYLLFVTLYAVNKNWFKPLAVAPPATGRGVKSTLKWMLSVGCLTFAGSTLLIGILFAFSPATPSPESWFTVGNLVQLRVSRIFLHATYFVIGILAFKLRWIERGRFPGHQLTCVSAFIFMVVAYYLAYFVMLGSGDGENRKLFGLIFWFCLNLFTCTTLLVAISLGLRYGNRQSSWGQKLAASSFYLYLSHYPLVIGFQLVLLFIPAIPILVKWGSVSIFSVGGGFLLSHNLIKPYPKVTIGFLVGVFAGMVLLLKP